MELVIKLSDETYDKVMNPDNWYEPDSAVNDVINAIKEGIPLPKGHGRLGDLDALREEVSSWGMNDYEPSDFIDEIDRSDTIIEADKENN